MNYLTSLPQALGLADTPTFAGIKGTNGQTILGNSSGAWTIAANGTNQNVTLTPSGTGIVDVGAGTQTVPAIGHGTTGWSLGPSGFSANQIVSVHSGSVGWDFTASLFHAGGAATLASDSTLSFKTAAGQANTHIVLPAASVNTLLGGLATDGALGSVLQIPSTATQGAILYNTSDVTTNYEGLRLRWTSNQAFIETVQAGTGVARILNIATTGAASVLFSTNGTLALTIDSSQNATFAGLTQNYGGAAGAATTTSCFQKAVASIANATATTVLTVTIPNAAHSASVRVRLVGSLGAGGAIGANEASGTVAYDIAITRTSGVNAVGTISAAFGSGMANVAGAATITVTAALGAVVGAVGASNTIPIQVTITRGSGSSANHTCQVAAEVVNANATGVTVA